MPVELAKRIRALFRSNDESSVELVMTANGVASLALSALAWLEFSMPLVWAAALVAGVFLLLTGCLLFRYSIWIAASIGSVTIAAAVGFLGARLMSGVLHGTWIGGALGAVGGLAIAVWTYGRVGRIARAAR
jgi:hypothetical protein